MKRLLLLFAGCFAAVVATAQSTIVTVTVVVLPCNTNGVVVATMPTAAPAPYTVVWNTNLGSVTHVTPNTTDTLTGYSGGYINCEVTANGGGSFYGNNPGQGAFPVSVATTPEACPVSGTATATMGGGTAPFSFAWSSPSGGVVSTTNPSSLPTGSYGLTVTDANGCIVSLDSGGGTNGIYIGNIPAFSLTSSSTVASCTNGTATINPPTGGSNPPYAYNWANGATTSTITGLTQGQYFCTVTDAIGCSVTKTAYVQQTPQLGATCTPMPATCLASDGASIAFGTGGMPPYSYTWSNGTIGQTITGVNGGFYTVSVVDANGCSGTSGSFIGSSTPITATYSTVPSSCTAPTGSATVTSTGGLPPYTIVWNTFPQQTGATASNLAPGVYSFHITDANGCIRTGAASIPPVVNLQVNLAKMYPVCLAANGSITANATGASSYTYSWSNGATTQTISSLTAGFYNVTVSEPSGCTKNFSTSLYATSPVNVSLVPTQATCIYNNDGALTATAMGGASPYTYSFNAASSGNTATNLGSGNYNVFVTDANGCTATAYTNVGYNTANTSCYCTVTGTVFGDANGNCAIDGGEAGIQNVQMHLNGFGYQYTNSAGQYTFKVPTGSYTLSQTVQAFYPLALCQTNNIAITAVAASGCIITNNFADTILPIHDIAISTWSLNQPVPGNAYTQQVIVSNQGTVTEPDVMAGYKNYGQLNAANFVPSVVFTNTATNYWNMASGTQNLNPASSLLTYVNYSVPTNIPMGTSVLFKDTASYSSPIGSWLNDYTPFNNVNYYQSIVVSSYDPNSKEVSPKGSGPNGNILITDSVLEYAVHFQNLGTYKAQNIYVLDTLDADLDWTTLKPLYLSHTGTITISETGILKATFPNIDLPPAIQNELLSNGMFTYSIRRKANLPLGTEFTNSAAIYFDYNAPVITNTTKNTLSAVGIEDFAAAKSGLKIFPNPAGQQFSIVTDFGLAENAMITVTNTQGQVVLSQNANIGSGAQQTSVNTGNLPSGIYFVTLQSATDSQTAKVVIVK